MGETARCVAFSECLCHAAAGTTGVSTSLHGNTVTDLILSHFLETKAFSRSLYSPLMTRAVQSLCLPATCNSAVIDVLRCPSPENTRIAGWLKRLAILLSNFLEKLQFLPVKIFKSNILRRISDSVDVRQQRPVPFLERSENWRGCRSAAWLGKLPVALRFRQTERRVSLSHLFTTPLRLPVPLTTYTCPANWWERQTTSLFLTFHLHLSKSPRVQAHLLSGRKKPRHALQGSSTRFILLCVKVF